MNCPRCESSDYIKHGFVNAVQRFYCKDCEYNYTVELKSTAKSSRTKDLAVKLYSEGKKIREISRQLKVSHTAVRKWIKNSN